MKRIFSILLCLTLCVALRTPAVMAAPSWPDGPEISAEGGILIDAGSGAMLCGKNIHETYYPASITKILTALIVIENCDLDEMVTFSHNAVYNVESGSSSAGLDAGDELSVRDCLYAMLLKSANEVANALAEHTAGSIEAFADMMNEKAASLGCVDSHFANPSGLNNPEHYTSAYDMALIARAAFENETFVTIDSTLYYDLPATKRSPDGSRIYPGHKMLKKNLAEYYLGIIGGKTGYTSLAGNTLVTCAERDGMRLVAVVLNGHQTHYMDTRNLLDFGFSNFRSYRIAEVDTNYASIANDMTIAGLPAADLSILYLKEDDRVTLPVAADITDAASVITYDLPADAPARAVAQISYEYDGRSVGTTWLMRKAEDAIEETIPEVTIPLPKPAPQETGADGTTPVDGIPSTEGTALTDETILPDSGNGGTDISVSTASSNPVIAFLNRVPNSVWITVTAILAAAALIGGAIYARYRAEKQEESDRELRYTRRQKRLHDIGISAADFDLLLQKKRDESRQKRSKSWRFPWKSEPHPDDKTIAENTSPLDAEKGEAPHQS